MFANNVRLAVEWLNKMIGNFGIDASFGPYGYMIAIDQGRGEEVAAAIRKLKRGIKK